MANLSVCKDYRLLHRQISVLVLFTSSAAHQQEAPLPRRAQRARRTSVGRYQKFYATIRIVKKYRDTRYYRDT